MKKLFLILISLFAGSLVYSKDLQKDKAPAHKLSFAVEEDGYPLNKIYITTSDNKTASVTSASRDDSTEIEVTPTASKENKGQLTMKIRFTHTKADTKEKVNYQQTLLGTYKKEASFSFKDKGHTYTVKVTPEKAAP